MTEYLSFPGLGIGRFHIDRIAVTVFGKGVAWYGILITIGMIIAIFIATRLAKKEKISSDTIFDLALSIIIFGVIGARLYYVAFTWSDGGYLVTDGTFWHNLGHTLLNIIAMWEGGMAIHGGIIAGVIVAAVFSKVKKIPFLKICDLLVPCVLIGQIIGRWGNFINVEVYGRETESFLRMGITEMTSAGTVISERFVHPTFLYESLWNLLIFVLVLVFYKKKKFDGTWFCVYLIAYGAARAYLETLRDEQYNLMIGPFKVSVLVGILMLVAGLAFFVILYSRYKARKLAGDYKPMFGDETPSGDVPVPDVTEVTSAGSDEASSAHDDVSADEKEPYDDGPNLTEESDGKDN